MGAQGFARATLASLAFLAGGATARADCFDWSFSGSTVESGTLRGLPSGPLAWWAGVAPAGGQHWMTAVEVRWTDAAGRQHRQELFDAVQDGRPGLRVRGGRLELRIAYCQTGQPCRGTTLPFTWDRARARFMGATPAARNAVAEACSSASTG